MRRTMHIRPGPWEPDGARLRREALLEIPGAGTRRLTFWAPASRGAELGDAADAFLIASIFQAMRRARRVRVHGRVSPSLLENLGTFTRTWRGWRPHRYHAPRILVAEAREDEDASGEEGAILSFSGGLDSCFSAWRHAGAPAGPGTTRLAAALMVHGFDIPLAAETTFALAAQNSRPLVEDLGLEFLTVATDVRALDDDWSDAHGAAVASCLHLFRRRHGAGLIAGSHSTDTLRFPWGSNPRTDPLLSTATFPIRYDAVEFSRMAKAASVAAWPEAMRRVRVCWEGKDKDRNCGACVRCLGTALCFAAEGAAIPASLPVGSLDEIVGRLASLPLTRAARQRLGELADRACANGIALPWVEALAVVAARPEEETETVGPWGRVAAALGLRPRRRD